MLNPSTADEQHDDPTIRRCVNFARSWGYGGVYVGNLFAYRATNPSELLKAKDPVGIDNIFFLNIMETLSELTVCAWGNDSILEKLDFKFPLTETSTT